MRSSRLERLFARILAVAPATALVVGCSSGVSPSTCSDSPPGHVDVGLGALEDAVLGLDAGADAGTGSFAAGQSIDGNACRQLCPPSGITTGFCSIESMHDGTATLACHRDCTGRRPAGLADDALIGTFAEMARLEAASIDAFRRLREELTSHGAPRRLLRACSRAARDEVRHARLMRSLARRRGELLAPPNIAPATPRSLEELATENAVEGCVRETWGALIATREACMHPDASVRAAMKRIAKDETRHAALAWELATWLEPRLDRAARERVRAARASAGRAIAGRMADAAAAAMAAELWAA